MPSTPFCLRPSLGSTQQSGNSGANSNTTASTSLSGGGGGSGGVKHYPGHGHLPMGGPPSSNGVAHGGVGGHPGVPPPSVAPPTATLVGGLSHGTPPGALPHHHAPRYHSGSSSGGNTAVDFPRWHPQHNGAAPGVTYPLGGANPPGPLMGGGGGSAMGAHPPMQTYTNFGYHVGGIGGGAGGGGGMGGHHPGMTGNNPSFSPPPRSHTSHSSSHSHSSR